MTITHPELVAALKKPGVDILASLTPEKVDAWHMASCIPGEAGELYDALFNVDRENIIEELGDLEFYLEGLRQALGVQYQPVEDEDHWPLYQRLPGAAGDVFDAVKKWVIYNKPLELETVSRALAALEQILHAIRMTNGNDREETIAANIAKLSVRYQSLSYSDAAAQARADKVAERAERLMISLNSNQVKALHSTRLNPSGEEALPVYRDGGFLLGSLCELGLAERKAYQIDHTLTDLGLAVRSIIVERAA